MKRLFLFSILVRAIDAPGTMGAGGSGLGKPYDGGGIVGATEGEAKHILKSPDAKEGGAEVIDTRAKQTVFSNWNDPYHKTGEAFEVHPKIAEDLLSTGLVSNSKGAAMDTIPADKRPASTKPDVPANAASGNDIKL